MICCVKKELGETPEETGHYSIQRFRASSLTCCSIVEFLFLCKIVFVYFSNMTLGFRPCRYFASQNVSLSLLHVSHCVWPFACTDTCILLPGRSRVTCLSDSCVISCTVHFECGTTATCYRHHNLSLHAVK
jgi:hypothetical protein